MLVAPAAVRILNLDDPVASHVRLPRARAGDSYRSLFAIAQLDGDLLGSAVISVDRDGRVPRDRLEFELRRQLQPELSEVLSGRSFLRESPPRTTRRNGNRRRATKSTARPYVSVVVTTCSNPIRLEPCLRSILACDHDNFEVIVVENRPGWGGTREMLAEHYGNDARVRYVEEPCRGLGWARNAGLAVADGDVIAFTDDDVIVDRAWIRRSAEAFEREDDIACVTGLILPLELETDSQLLLEQFMTLGKGFSRQIFRLPEALDTHPLLPYTAGVVGSGANTVLRADVALQMGGFDPNLGTGTPAAGGEDLDLYIRLLRAGHAVAYEPSAIVWHAHPSDTSKLRRQVYWYGVGLGAALAKQLIAGPERRHLLGAVPAGIRYLLDPASRKNAGKTRDHPRRLDWLERFGILVGPAAYLASVLLHLCVSLAPQRRNLRLHRVKPLALANGTVVDVVDVADQPVWRARVRPASRKRAYALSGPAERVILATALAACVAAPLLVAVRAPTALRFGAVLALLCLAPGAALISAFRGRAEFGLVLGASLGSSVVLGELMLWLGWQPELFLYGLAVVCLAPLWARLHRPRQGPRATPIDRVRSAAASIPSSVALHGALLTAAMAAWLTSLAGTDLNRMAGLGLLDALPTRYFLAFALLLLGFAVAVTRHELEPRLLGVYTLALIIVLHGTTALLYQVPRYQWVYNHFAVIDFIAKTGAANRQIDIYNNWPGFFALNAWLSTVSGLKPATYAPWAQVFFNIANVAALRFALRGLTRDERLLWTASWFFLLGNWVGQDYLAPQAFGFALSLVIIGLCLRCSPRPRTPREPRLRVTRWLSAQLDRRRTRVLRSAAVAEPVADPPLSPRTAVIVGGLCYLAVVVSHQLTPVVLVIWVVMLALLARVLPWWVAVAMAVIEAFWVALAWPYVGAHFSLFNLDPTAGTTPTGAGISGGLPGHQLVTDAARLVVVQLVALAAIGVVQRLRRSRWDLSAAILAVAPILVVALQSYGGEARYRSYLFALPWLCFFGAAALTPASSSRLWPALRSWRVALVSAAVAVCMLFAYFGLEYINRLTQDDVAVGVWFDRHAPPRSLFVTVTANAVSRVTARYAVVSNRAYPDSPALTDDAGFAGHTLGKHNLPAIETALRRYGVTPTFLVLTESEQHYARLYGLLPNDWRASLDQALRASRSFTLVYHHGTSEIFEFSSRPAVGARR